MKNTERDYSHIKGWGIDADPLDVPAYPMKRRTENDNKGMIWERPAQQPAMVEVLHSNERPGLSAVFGTPNPPAGLSGKIRRFAFRYSESMIRHWLLLLIADRVNMIEGVHQDIQSGHVPDFFSELGGKSELKYNKPGLIRKIALGSLITIVAVAWLGRKRR
ncbi:hypothetical protein DYBT9623_00552 [Dyadobacter sp. CECT 9623]|uniref:Uncharacterized protein n=1 Tax=Dyadobacter linearis TaxID=2823330 RepID=A0ABM8UK87_9BACT|nr:hypothetical protein [Dyadobacter sp. CECT 9623]CAG5067825.1 hypothetical protein DYBT9623_00552 [Dyadobacter sp. CECT 9623]